MIGRFTTTILLSCLLCVAAIGQEAANAMRPWMIRVTVFDGWGKNHKFWMTSESQIGFADLSTLGLTLPCSGDASLELVTLAETSLAAAIDSEVASSKVDSQCADEPRVAAEIFYGITADRSHFLEFEYSAIVSCRSHRIPSEIEEAIDRVIEAGSDLRASCPAVERAP